MGKESVDKQIITEYLLGASPESEQERLDEMSLTNDEFVDRLRAVENDLIDSYVRGELSSDALTKFNTHYLASPIRREKVRFAEILLGFADKSIATKARNTRSAALISPAQREAGLGASSRWRFFSLWRPALQWSLATAALLILIGSGYLFFQNLRLQNQMDRTQAERAALGQREQELQRQLDQQRSSDAETEKELAQVRDRLAELEQQLATAQQRRKPDPEQKSIAFSLSPQTRGVPQIATLTVPAGTDYVALALELETEDFPTYQAELKNPATGQIIWRSGGLKASGKRKTLRVSLRASLLNSQNYVLELSSGVAGNVGSYPFKVVKQ